MSYRDWEIDERTGLRVRSSRLRRDWYTGALTEDPDPPHPQDYPRTPGPDLSSLRDPAHDPQRHDLVTRLEPFTHQATLEAVVWPKIVATGAYFEGTSA